MTQPVFLEVVRLTPDEARALTDRIKSSVEETWELIKQAYQARAWVALDYPNWDYYCRREFGTSRIRLPLEERQEVVRSMREIGMSTRAIGAGIGVDAGTVRNDLKAVKTTTEEKSSPTDDDVIDAEVVDEVIGVDGRTYHYPVKPSNRKPLPGQFLTVATELSRILARVEQLKSDDRFTANRNAISEQCAPQIRRTIEVLTDLLNEVETT